jgi:hypothetical protein
VTESDFRLDRVPIVWDLRTNNRQQETAVNAKENIHICGEISFLAVPAILALEHSSIVWFCGSRYLLIPSPSFAWNKIAKATWKPSCVASSRSSLSFNSGVHTVKYEVVCLGVVEVAGIIATSTIAEIVWWTVNCKNARFRIFGLRDYWFCKPHRLQFRE